MMQPRPFGRRPRRPAQDAAPRAPGLSPGRITALAAAGCVLAVLLTMLAPSAMFTLGDAARFSNAARMDTPYQSRTVEGDDLYLVRMLNERAEAESAAYQAEASDGNSSQPIYFGGEDSLQRSPQLVPRCEELLNSMLEAGILTVDQAAAGQILIDGYPDRFFGGSDTLGFLTIVCSPADNTAEPVMRMVLESRTGKVVSFQLWNGWNGWPDDYNGLESIGSEVDTEAVLRAWVAMNDLDILGDWTVPENTIWQDTGLYSARGGLLATCVTVMDDGNALGGVALDLVPCTPQQMQAAALAGEGDASGITNNQLYTGGGLVDVRSDFCNTYREVYFLDGGYDSLTPLQVLCMDASAGTVQIACRKPDCTHSDESCPAVVGDAYDNGAGAYLHAANGKLYVLLPACTDGEGTRRPPRIVELSADRTGKRTVAALTGDNIEYLAGSVSTVYGLLNTSGSAGGTQPRRLVAVDLATGQRTLTPALIGPDEQITGCYNGCLVAVRRVYSRAWLPENFTVISSWLRSQATRLEVELIDPAAGSHRHVAWLPGNDILFSQPYSANEFLFVTEAGHVSTDGVAQAENLPATVVNLRSGSNWQFDLPEEDVYSLTTYASLSAPGVEQRNLVVYRAPDSGGLYDPATGEVRQLPRDVVVQGWFPAALTSCGLLVQREGTAGEILGIADPDALLYTGADAIRPVF